MKLDGHPPASPSLNFANAKSVLAIWLSFACIFSLGLDLPLPVPAAAAPAAAKGKKPKQDPALKGLPITDLTADEAILHALNRLAYGPRPGDVERVRQTGLAKWIDQQLNPNSIDDVALDARLENYPTLHLSTANLMAEYPQPKQAEKQAAKQARVPSQPQTPQSRSDAAAAVIARDMQPAPKRPSAQAATAASDNAAPSVPPQPAAAPAAPVKEVSMKDAPAQGTNIATPGPGGKRDPLGGDPNAVPRNIADDSKRPARVIEELAMAKVTRAIYSQRQLAQIVDDFWFNHFNVFAGKGEDRYYLTSYERDVIQPHEFGKFKDLLIATAKSPAMLFYLDNFLSADPNAAARLAAQRAMRQQMRYNRFGQPIPPRVPASAPAKEQRPRAQRELRPRVDGAAHSRRGRWLHSERCDRGRPLLYRLDHRKAARISGIQV